MRISRVAHVILALSGHTGVGKDVIARYLIAKHAFIRVGFSDALKHEVATKLRRTLEAHIQQTFSWGLIEQLGMDRLVHRVVWERRTPVTRALLQEFGSEVRRADERDYWVRRTAEKVNDLPPSANVVLPDCRFENECRMVRALNGYLLKITRPGYFGDSHMSETSLNAWTDFDVVLVNNGTVEDLEDKVERWLTSVKA